MGREVVSELIQSNLTPETLARELDLILDGPGREQQLEAYEILRQKLGGEGASNKAAKLIVDFSKVS